MCGILRSSEQTTILLGSITKKGILIQGFGGSLVDGQVMQMRERFPWWGILSQKGTYVMVNLGTGILNNHHMEDSQNCGPFLNGLC